MSTPLTREDPAVEVSTFIGRRREVSAVRRLLARERLVTLTGAGGVGKTRLALRVAEVGQVAFPDGVEVVELATLEDAGLLEPAVAAALGLREPGPRPVAALAEFLAGRRMLLVLDNCEHLLPGCARLVDGLLRGAPRLRILATSRQSLGVYGEQVMAVPSLSIPDTADGPSRIARHESVRLLAERAAGVRPGFEVNAANARTLARVSQRLDGIPLAIELAAVRLRSVPVERLMRELDERFEVLTGGSPSALPRHQTLRATMDWSYGLCSPAERRLWSRLSMFPGGADLAAAENVCAGGGIEREEVLDLLTGLVDKSVLVGERRETGIRYRMLETVRAHGRERLEAADLEPLRRGFTRHYEGVAERSRLDRLVPDQLERYRAMQVELPNVRVAMDLCFADPRTAATGLSIASKLWAFSLFYGSLTEVRHWLERGLELVAEPHPARVRSLWVDSLLAVHQGDLAAAMPRLEECQVLARRAGDETNRGSATRIAGLAAFARGDFTRGLALLEEALARHRAAGAGHEAAMDLFYAAAYGSTADPGRAAGYGEEYLALCEARGSLVWRAYALFGLGMAAWNQGDRRRAESLMRESAQFRGAIDDRWGLTQCLEVLAWTACARGRHERAARLLGAAHTLWSAMDASPTRLGHHVRWHRLCEAQARAALGDRRYETSFRAGERLRAEQAVDFALDDERE